MTHSYVLTASQRPLIFAHYADYVLTPPAHQLMVIHIANSHARHAEMPRTKVSNARSNVLIITNLILSIVFPFNTNLYMIQKIFYSNDPIVRALCWDQACHLSIGLLLLPALIQKVICRVTQLILVSPMEDWCTKGQSTATQKI